MQNVISCSGKNIPFFYFNVACLRAPKGILLLEKEREEINQFVCNSGCGWKQRQKVRSGELHILSASKRNRKV
jgi:hypothetical protein